MAAAARVTTVACKQILGELFAACLNMIDRAPDAIACPQIVNALCRVLLHPELLAEDGPFPSKGFRIAYERKAGLSILTHRHPTTVWSKPHDHGRTWAIYGVMTGKTAMYEYEAIGDKRVKLTRSYWVHPGQAHWYPVGTIHSHQTHGDSKLIRIEGVNMHRKENKVGGRYYTLEAT